MAAPTRRRATQRERQEHAAQVDAMDGAFISADRASRPTAVAVFDPKKAAANITSLIDNRSEKIAHLLGGDPQLWERFRAVALHAITSNQKLLQADQATVIEAVIQSATLGLEPTGVSGQAYILPFWNKRRGCFEAKLITGWRGMLKLIERGGRVASVDAQVVFEHDEFEIEFGSDPFVRHRPALARRGSRVGVYAIGLLRSGARVIEWMSEADVEIVRKSSRAADDGPWVDWWEEMARKTVIRRLAKRLPLDHVAEAALAREDALDQSLARPPEAPAVSAGAARPGLARVRERLGIAAPAATDEDSSSAPGDASDEPPDAVATGDPPTPATAASASDGVAGSVTDDVIDGEAREISESPPADSGPADPCGDTPPENGMAMTDPCWLEAGHKGAHKSAQGSWPQAKQED